MRTRVIFQHSRYWPQYKFAGLMWRYYTTQDDPYRQPEPVSFVSMLDAISYCKDNTNDNSEVVWQSN